MFGEKILGKIYNVHWYRSTGAGGQGLMLWPKMNFVLQFIYWASIYLLKVTNGNTKVWNLVKVNNKDTRLMLLTPLRCPNYHLQTHFTSWSSNFSVSIVNFEQVKSWLGSRSHLSKKPLYSSFVVRKKRRKNVKNVVRGELKTSDTSKMDLFAKIVCCLKSLTILTRSSILRSITGGWNILCLLQMSLNATIWHIL